MCVFIDTPSLARPVQKMIAALVQFFQASANHTEVLAVADAAEAEGRPDEHDGSEGGEFDPDHANAHAHRACAFHMTFSSSLAIPLTLVGMVGD